MPQRSVLLVDDDDAVREVAAVALKVVGGLQVRTASAGNDALTAASADPPDVVLMDVMMPGMDGPTVLARLRADPRTAAVPIVFLTAKSSDAESGDWQQLGVAGVISKPFDPMTLARDLSVLLGWGE